MDLSLRDGNRFAGDRSFTVHHKPLMGNLPTGTLNLRSIDFARWGESFLCFPGTGLREWCVAFAVRDYTAGCIRACGRRSLPLCLAGYGCHDFAGAFREELS